MDRNLFNINQLYSKSKIASTAITDFQYADYCAVCAHSVEEFQVTLDRFCEAYKCLDSLPIPQKPKYFTSPLQINLLLLHLLQW